jgi:redox-sensitive bicupin YhaK (pirin superfamily)
MSKDHLLVRSEDLPHVMEGAGALVKRVVGPGSPVRNVGPLVLLDHADIPPGVGFPMHPHSGFEILTYIMEGEVRHKDSEGFEAVVGGGGMQHLVTGRGMWHEEMPGDAGAKVLQIWVSLPPEARNVPPAYRSIPSEEAPEVKEDGVCRKALAGIEAPVRFHHPVAIQDIHVREEGDLHAPSADGSLVLYAISGSSLLCIGSDSLRMREGDLLLLREPRSIKVKPGEGAFRLALFQIQSGE